MSSFSKISLGNGKFCYSGPHCRQHGVIDPSTITTLSQFKKLIEERTQDSYVAFRKYVCENSKDVTDLAELGKDAFDSKYAAHKCEEHGVYHYYEVQPASVFLRAFGLGAVQDVVPQMKERVFNKEESLQVRAIASEAYKISSQLTFRADKGVLYGFQRKMHNTEMGQQAYQERLVRSAEARESSIWTPKEAVPYEPVKIAAADVDDKVMLEYWQCGRKKVYDTFEKADAFIKKTNEANPMTAYVCSHCGQYHTGHGGGGYPVEEQLVRAREHWDSVSEKSNIFAFAKGLI